MCPYKVRESRKDIEDGERERDGIDERVEKWNREVVVVVEGGGEGVKSLRRRVKNMGLAGWVKGALVPIKSHYCRLITQGSCCLHRYERWLWNMNNSARQEGHRDPRIRWHMDGSAPRP